MEDKWFIFFDEPYLFLHRSWTGQPVYRVEFETGPQGATVRQALWSADAPGGDAEHGAALLDFLISNLLLGQSRPFPLAPGTDPANSAIEQHVWSGTASPTELPPKR